jgi:hypothetical protein
MRTGWLGGWVLLFGSLVAADPAAARRGVPPTIELDGCVQPSTKCRPTSDVVDMVVDGRKVPFGVETLRFVTSTNASPGKTLTELRLRPLRVQGPKPLTQQLEAGARRRVRGMLRLSVGYLLLQAVEPLDEKP